MRHKLLVIAVALVVGASGCARGPTIDQAPQAALTVQVIDMQERELSSTIDTAGPLQAWQEVDIGSEIAGYRIIDVRVDVGDKVRKDDVLARLDDALLRAEVAQAEAAVAQAAATQKEAKANAERATALLKRGATSAQEAEQQLTTAATAEAQLATTQAQLGVAQQRLRYMTIRAPDDGVISARTVSLGQLASVGGTLFKLVRRSRVEWRAEIAANDMSLLKPNMKAQVLRADGTWAEGKVRAISPTLDPNSRRGIAYVDLALEPGLRPGMYATGKIQLGQNRAWTLPLSAITTRDGFSYAFTVQSNDIVQQRRVRIGRMLADAVEVVDGLKPGETVVASGAGFLRDGDRVRVVTQTQAKS